MTYLTEESNLILCYLMYFKAVYLILRTIEQWYNNEVAFKQLNNFYATNEDYYLKTIARKTILKIFNMVIMINIDFNISEDSLRFLNFFKKRCYAFFPPLFCYWYMQCYNLI